MAGSPGDVAAIAEVLEGQFYKKSGQVSFPTGRFGHQMVKTHAVSLDIFSQCRSI